MTIIQLQGVRPAREIRIPAMRQNYWSGGSFDSAKVLGRLGMFRWRSVNEILRMRFDPRVIQGHVIGNKIEQKSQPMLLKALTKLRQGIGCAEIRVQTISPNGKGRPTDIGIGKIRQRCLVLFSPVR